MLILLVSGGQDTTTERSSEGKIAMGEATAGQVQDTYNPDAATAARYKQEFPWADQVSVEIMLGAIRLASTRTTAMNRFFEAIGSVRSAGRYTLLRIRYFAEEGTLTQIEIVNALGVTSPHVT